MKKILSVLLTLVMVISCLSMVVFVASASGTETPAYDAVKLTITGSGYITSGKGIFEADASFTGTKTVKFAIKNIGTTDASYDIWIQGDGQGWETPSGETRVAANKSIKPGKVQIASVTIPVENGKVSFSSGKPAVGIETLYFRINPAGSGEIIITAYESDEHNANAVLGAWNSSGSRCTATPALVSDHLVALEPVNNGLEDGGASWGAWRSSGDYTATADSDDATNTVAKFTAANEYGSVSYDVTSYVLGNDTNPFYNGYSVGYYTVTFRAKAEAGKGGVFNVCLAGDVATDNVYSQNKYSATGGSFTMTDEWKTFTTYVQVTEENVNVWAANNDTKINVRLDGSNGVRAFETGVFTYYIDDVQIEYASALKFTKQGTGSEYATKKAYTKDMVKDGYITESFYVYNLNSEPIKVRLYHQNGWSDPTGAESSQYSITKTIPANTKMLYEFKLPATADGDTYKVFNAAITELTLRVQVDAGWMPQGSTFIVEEVSENGILPSYLKETLGKNLGLAAIGAEDIPNYAEPVVTEKPADPTEAPEYVGVKFTAKSASTGQQYTVTKGGTFAADATFTGTKTITYTIYNTSDKDIHFILVFCALVNGGWSHPNAGVGALLEPGESAQLTASVDVVDGNVSVAGTPVTLNNLLIRLNATFQGSGSEIGDTFVVATNGQNDKLLGTLQTQFTAENITELPVVATTPPTEPSPTAVADKVVTNGDVEDGKTNWGYIHAGSAEVTADPDDSDNNVIIFTPDSTNQYSSVAFDFGPAIIQNAEEGYKGGGAGEYIISFRAKAEAGKGGKFIVVLNSMAHFNKNASFTVDGEPVAISSNTYSSGTTITMTDEWQTFEASVKITEEMLQAIEYVHDSTHAKASVAYKVVLRLDGAAERAFGTERFVYYIDDATITKVVPEGGEPEEEQKPVGIKIETSATEKTSMYYCTGTGLFAADATFTGEKEITYTVYNTSDKAITITLTLQGTVNKGWAGPNNGKSVAIPAGGVAEITTSVPVTNGVVTATYKDVTEDLTLDKIFARFDIKIDEVEPGDAIVIAGNVEDDVIYKTPTGKHAKLTATPVFELPKAEEKENPTGTQFVAVQDIDADGNACYLVTNVNGGIVSTADIKGGEVTKSFKVKNTSKETIQIKLELQAVVSNGASNTWAAAQAGEFVEIAPGETVTVSYSVEVNDDNTVTIKDSDVSVDKLFARFDVKNEDGAFTFSAGTSFVIYADGDDYALISAMQTGKNAWNKSAVYDTGDAVPYVLIAMMVLSATGLVILNKKREEN